jgi:hypothetical protein
MPHVTRRQTPSLSAKSWKLLFLEAGTQAVGNGDASGDVLYAADAGIAQTPTGNSANDVFVVYNSADVVVPKAGGHDAVYSAVNYTLPTGVDVLYLEAGVQGTGNGDASGDALYAVDAGIAQTLFALHAAMHSRCLTWVQAV